MTGIKSSPWYASRLRWLGWGSAAALLALPAIAMQAGAEGVLWTASDFLIFAVMLLVLGGGIELAVAATSNWAHRLGGALMALAGFLTVWVNLAVGMIGSEDNPYNLLFLGNVIAVAIGAALVRGRAAALAKIALAAGAVQLVAAALGTTSDPRGAVFSMAFALPWLVAAALLRGGGYGQQAAA